MVLVHIPGVEGLLYGLDRAVPVHRVNYISHAYKIGGYDINHAYITI